MRYITFAEFEELTERTFEISEEEFTKLLPKSSAILDSATSHFYKLNSLEKDHAFRRNQFKLALCTQIQYFHSLGATTFEEINNTPQTFQAGRTSVSNSSRYNPNGANESKPLLSKDVYVYLDGTGLLYSGVNAW
ncbi:hypothetical protein [Sutcliffiella sp. BMC8]|uniref:hypothetical protein n=1 Tax=Sutcliffiella sp. BMC8 TaxID=3073243 RepID=UPI0030CD4DA1